MKILFLAPEPFFHERGTPIAIKLAVNALQKRKSTVVDLLTYHEGESVELNGANHYRIPNISFIKNIPPGISIKKIICDIFFLFSAIKLVLKSLRTEKYDLVHCVEESVFIGWFIKFIWAIPYVYDMDSSISRQLVEKWTLLKPIRKFFDFFEKLVIKDSLAVIPMCDSLVDMAKEFGAKKTFVLKDISLLNLNATNNTKKINLREESQLSKDSKIILYVGNLEHYQGVELLINSFEKIEKNFTDWFVVIIGGAKTHIAEYLENINRKSLEKRVILLGPRAVEDLGAYLTQADILASPRTHGSNTPMKIYSYLHSGIPIIATNLLTHTQVLNKEVSLLAEPESLDFSEKLSKLMSEKSLREKIGKSAFQLAEKNHTEEAFERELNFAYDGLF